MSEFIKSIKVKTAKDSNDFYHGQKDFISSSGIKKIKKSPAHFMEPEKINSEALTFGSAYHCYVLEPDNFDNEYFVFDETEILEILRGEGAKSPRATNIYKEWHENQMRIAADKTMLSSKDFEVMQKMKDRLFSHYYCRSLLKNGDAELSHYAEIETFNGLNIKTKVRPDYLKKEKRIVVDLKTCRDASVQGFQKDAASLDYHISAALYNDVVSKHYSQDLPWTFFFIAQEKTAPYAFNIFEASPQFISQGRYEYEMLLMLYDYCLKNDTWPGYQVFCENKYGVQEILLPPWAINEINYYEHKI